MTEVMLDIETYSTEVNACIMTIGAIKFSRNSQLQEMKDMDTFYRRITIESNKELFRDISNETIKWWSTQPEEASKEITIDENRMSLTQALLEFKEWFGDSEFVWSHGDDFDTVVVGTAMKDCGVDVPWKFWNTRDTRTLFDLAGVRNYHLPTVCNHHALYDCHRQITGVLMALRRLGL